ncbi:MAG: hypothetical protein M1830_003580 [Pleopsidium flavum]|nr:MAG: hypothetical protein M1830_003837 [Pleopsidium flavum]KAI9870968.1 MAG: hypothetical protein M1830_003580 [Pleopsidium flavum]
MAPQESIPVAANVLGTIGTIFWCIQLVPQIWYNWRQKKTEGLPGLMMFLWAACAVPFGVYTVVQNFNIPVQIQPQIFCVLSLVSWTQILIYNNDWKTWKATLLGSGVGVLFGGVEALLILTLRVTTLVHFWDRVVLTFGGSLSSRSVLAYGVGRCYSSNIARAWLAAAVLRDLEAARQSRWHHMLLETGIFASHVVWLLRTRKLRKQAKLAGQSFDDLPEAQPYQVKRLGTEEETKPPSIDIEKGDMQTRGLPEAQDLSCARREGEGDRQIS